MTTTTVNTTTLLNKLGDVLGGGMLTQATKDAIAGFINNPSNFPTQVTIKGTTSSPPADATTSRDMLRAAVQQILVSPEYAIQR